LWDNTFEIYEEVQGFTGYIKLSDRVIRQEKLIQEIDQNLKRFDLPYEKGRHNYIRRVANAMNLKHALYSQLSTEPEHYFEDKHPGCRKS